VKTPHEGDEHAHHDVANLTSQHGGTGVGRRVCLTCEAVVGELVLCNRPTKKGRPCRVPVRPDLGYSVCTMHHLTVGS